jgi:D-alanine transaminase
MNSNPVGILTVRELEIMDVLWHHGPMRVRDVQSRLPVRLAYTTVLTTLRTLEVKGQVRHEADGIAHVFEASVSHSDVARESIRFVKHRMLGGCAESLCELILDESRREGDVALEGIRRAAQQCSPRRGRRPSWTRSQAVLRPKANEPPPLAVAPPARVMVYLNGGYMQRADAVISLADGGFVFGDGVYEVIRARGGALFEVDRHVCRLQRGLAILGIAMPPDNLPEISRRLLQENHLARKDALVYWHVPRDGTPAAVYASATPHSPPHDEQATGVSVALVADERSGRCDLKTRNLLANVLAKQRAVVAGAYEAIFVRDGLLLTGSSTNVFGVIDGVVRTGPRSDYILPGVTRDVVLELAPELGLPVQQDPIAINDLPHLSECFLTSTSNDVMPVVALDGRPVGNGEPGPITRRLSRALRVGVDRGSCR